MLFSSLPSRSTEVGVFIQPHPMSFGESKLISAAPAFRKSLLVWFFKNHRPLPWRKKTSAYRTVVSELMSQQTQLTTVIPYFEKWVKKWPDFATLAKAKESEVLAAWAGLGYYSRARHLWQLACQVVDQENSPRTAAEWKKFKGVGPYTAAAIASISFAEPVAVVDGNVVRVLARLTASRTLWPDRSVAVKHFTPLANTLIDSPKPGDFNQAMMELGALICRKSSPLCEQCPVSRWCQAKDLGVAEKLPRFAARDKKQVVVQRALVTRADQLLLKRHPLSARRLAGMAEIPLLVDCPISSPSSLWLSKRRTIGSVTYIEQIYTIQAETQHRLRVTHQVGLEWVKFSQLAQAALAGPHYRWIQEWLSRGDRTKLGKPLSKP